VLVWRDSLDRPSVLWQYQICDTKIFSPVISTRDSLGHENNSCVEIPRFESGECVTDQASPKRSLSQEQKVGFAHEFRIARAGALRDAEAFEEHLFVLERLGSFVCGHRGGLFSYREALSCIASRSPLGTSLAKQNSELHLPFDTLYEQIRNARNDAMHQGTVARHLARHAQELALIMEDALMSEARTVKDFMVRAPLCAALWQPLGTIRRSMLMNAFSFLPFECNSANTWRFISDHSLARYLRVSHKQRERRMLLTLEEALKSDEAFSNDCEIATIVDLNVTVGKVAGLIREAPCIVLDDKRRLAGLVTAFDIL
jgi:hypothetical protein